MTAPSSRAPLCLLSRLHLHRRACALLATEIVPLLRQCRPRRDSPSACNSLPPMDATTCSSGSPRNWRTRSPGHSAGQRCARSEIARVPRRAALSGTVVRRENVRWTPRRGSWLLHACAAAHSTFMHDMRSYQVTLLLLNAGQTQPFNLPVGVQTRGGVHPSRALRHHRFGACREDFIPCAGWVSHPLPHRHPYHPQEAA